MTTATDAGAAIIGRQAAIGHNADQVCHVDCDQTHLTDRRRAAYGYPMQLQSALALLLSLTSLTLFLGLGRLLRPARI